MSEEIEAHICKRFDIQDKMGKGAYGVVWKAVEIKTNKKVALKKVFEAFHNSTDAQRTYREIMILSKIKSHENIIKLREIIKAENNRDIYLVFDFMETDLHSVIKAGILKEVHIQFIIYQLLKGIKYLHSGDLIHRDLKPSNILINSNCTIKIADFGLAWSVNQQHTDEVIMTEFVATRWYRAPEIVLGSKSYSKAVDMWSVGCILAELVNQRPLFPGQTSLHQIQVILETIGKPSQKDIISLESEAAQNLLRQIPLQKFDRLENCIKTEDPLLLDFLKKTLCFNMQKRIAVEEALRHPYLAKFHQPEKEKQFSQAVSFELNDNKKLSVDQYRELIYKFIQQGKNKIQFQRQRVLKITVDMRNLKETYKENIKEKSKEKTSKRSITNQLFKQSTTNLKQKSLQVNWSQSRKTIEHKPITRLIKSSIDEIRQKQSLLSSKSNKNQLQQIAYKSGSTNKMQNYYQQVSISNKY